MAMAPSGLPKDTAKCVAPIPVPTHGPGGVFSVACSTTIAAPALSCLEKVLDLSSYPAWNTFVPAATLKTPGHAEGLAPELHALASRPGYVSQGARFRFNAVMSPGGASRAIDLEITFLEAFNVPEEEEEEEGKGRGYRVAWKTTGIPHFVLHSERVQEFVEGTAADGSAETHYACWETFGGLTGYVMPRAQLEDGFGRWMNGLKKAVEETK